MTPEDIKSYFHALDQVVWSSSFIYLLELPLAIILLGGVLKWWLRDQSTRPYTSLYKPRVSCIITCYSEGRDVEKTLTSLCEQIYEGEIELIPVVDGAAKNKITLEAARNYQVDHRVYPRRRIHPVAKWQRGGRVSSLNTGLALASGEIVLALDGDTSFDNDMIRQITRHFENPNVQAVAGNLRVRNTWESIATAIQALEYLLSISMARIGLSEWNIINNISGAFGAFRRSTLIQVGGWNTHTAEDLDLTLRLKSYFRRHPEWLIPFEPRAFGHTDVPSTFRDFLKQRLRWDGDLLFLYARKHKRNISPKLMGWPNFITTVTYGLFVQTVLPFIILIHSTELLVHQSWHQLATLAFTIYGAYLLLATLQYGCALILCSETPERDIRLMPVLFIFPIVMFVIRCWSAVAMLNELIRRGHEETAMAPWWVLNRANHF
jgi:cellulose synthase/poly-beta-1,6-N-acetylglucosamine synthase-like glycosyltransferase